MANVFLHAKNNFQTLTVVVFPSALKGSWTGPRDLSSCTIVHTFRVMSHNILARQDRWFEKGVKEANYSKLRMTNRGGGLQHLL